jgi:hypothetical protein
VILTLELKVPAIRVFHVVSPQLFLDNPHRFWHPKIKIIVFTRQGHDSRNLTDMAKKINLIVHPSNHF